LKLKNIREIEVLIDPQGGTCQKNLLELNDGKMFSSEKKASGEML
jgi:hypothetical protein